MQTICDPVFPLGKSASLPQRSPSRVAWHSNVFLELTQCAIFSCVSVKATSKSFGDRFGNGYSPFHGLSDLRASVSIWTAPFSSAVEIKIAEVATRATRR
jgi:hypothetical protein